MADKTGYIGRNPNDSAVVLARQFFTASGVTTTFTFASGYLTGFLDVYVDGVKRRVADEFTATDGSTFDVLQGGVSAGSTVEAVAYKAFNAAATVGDVTGNFNVSGNTTLDGSLSVTGGTTLSNLNVTGITTLGAGTTVAFANTAFNLGGTPDISVDLLSAVDINVSGAATIGGVLTYEDVTNIDSVGIVTARTGVEVTANGLVVNAGVSTFAADVSIADKIVHTGDTNTAIRFPSVDTITAETAGVERVRIDSNGDVGLVGIATATGLVVVAGSGVYAGHTGVVTAVTFDGNLTGNVTGDATGLSGSPDIAVTNITAGIVTTTNTLNAADGHVELLLDSGNGRLKLNSSGDATNIDLFGSDGSATFKGDLTIADKIIHDGDTNTAIRFPAADTFTVETGGSERFRVDSSGRVLIGASSSADVGFAHGLQVESLSSNRGISIIQNSNDQFASHIDFAKTRGTSTGSNTAVQSGDDLGSIIFRGADGTDKASNAAFINCEVDGTPGSNDMPGRLIFATTADGASSSTERLRIASDGTVIVGTDTTVNPILRILGSSSHNSFIQFADGDSNNIGQLQYSHSSNALIVAVNSAERLRIDSSGNLGLGEASSIDARLHVNSGTDNATLFLESTDGDVNLCMADDAGSCRLLQEGGNLRFRAGGNANAFGTGDSEKMVLTSSGRLVIGATSARTNFATTPQLQVEGTNFATSSLSITRNSNDSGRPTLFFGKSRGTSDGAVNVVSDGDALGTIEFTGADGTDMARGALIQAVVDGTPGSDDMPARLLFYTSADGSQSPTERLRIDSTGRVFIDTSADRPIEMPFGNTLNSAQPGKLVIEDSGAGNLNMIIARENQSNAYGPAISLVKSRGTSDGSYTVVQNGDNLGTIQFGGADGSADRVGAAIVAQVNGTPGSDDMPGRLMFAITPDGSGHPTERLRITSSGAFNFNNGMMIENVNINTTARNGTQNVDLADGMVHFFTSSSTASWKPNFRVSSSENVNGLMSTGDTASVTMIVNKSNTSHIATTIQIDGTDVTPEFLGGEHSDGGGNNTYDVYHYTIIKTGDGAFTVFAAVNNYT